MLDPEQIRNKIFAKIKKELILKQNIPKDKMWVLGWNDYIQEKKCRTTNKQYLGGWDTASQVTATVLGSCELLTYEFVSGIDRFTKEVDFQRAFAHELN